MKSLAPNVTLGITIYVMSSKQQHLLIGEVVQRTGLTERAIRYYEERGLVAPTRTSQGLRMYGERELIRLHHISLLRRARFSLSQIDGILGQRDFNAKEVLDTQIEALEGERALIEHSLAKLRTVRDTVIAKSTIDAETLCTLIKLGEAKMVKDDWQKIYDKYYTPEQQREWEESKKKLAANFDQEAYEKKWADLSTRIEAALPLGPACERAQAFLVEWNALLEPFTAIATPEMKVNASELWQHMDEWSDQVNSPISKKVWDFITATSEASCA